MQSNRPESKGSGQTLPSETNTTRREFLGLLGKGAVGVAVLTQIEARPVSSIEVKEGMGWKEGIAALMKDVFESPVETDALFLQKNDGVSIFFSGKDGEKTRARGQRLDQLPVNIRKALEGGAVTSIVNAHTHTLETATVFPGITHERIADMRERGEHL